MFTLLKGIILGIFLALPVGPIGILGLQKTIIKGKDVGFFSGLGIASADFVYAILAVLGFISIVNIIPKSWVFPLTLLALIFLIAFAIKIFFTKIEEFDDDDDDDSDLVKDYWKMFGLTLTNPVTLVTFVSLMKLFDVPNILWKQLLFALGVFVGSVAWWKFITTLIDNLKDKFNVKIFERINKLLSIILISFVAYELLTMFKII